MRRIARGLGLTGASSLVALLCCEAFVRLAGLGPAPHPVSVGKVVKPSPDPVLGFEHRPHSARARAFQEARGSEPRIALYTINQHGFRGAAVELEKPPDALRIACVGDSFTFGTGVSDHEAWPAVLERLLEPALRETHPETRVEVMNCGVGGYNTTQEAVYLEKRVLRFEPDLVLCCLYLNDVMIGNQPPPAEVGEWVGVARRWTRPERSDWVRTARRASVLLDLACDRVYNGLESMLYTERHADVFLEDGEGWRLVREGLVRMRDASEARGAEFVLVLYPQMIRQGAVLASHAAYAVVLDFAREQGLRVLDLEPAFLGQPVERFWVHPSDLHPNAEGNALAARAVADYLLASDLLTRAR